MYVYDFLLLCFISVFASLDLDFAKLCALRGLVVVDLWGHLLVWLDLPLLCLVWVWPFVRHISVMLVCLIHTFLYFVRCCCACFVPLVWHSLLLCIFARLLRCSCISLYVIHIPISWNYGHSIQTYICPPRTPPFV